MFVIVMLTPVQDYPKLSQSYYTLLECLAQDHMTFISNLEPQVFLYIMATISEGLAALGKLLQMLNFSVVALEASVVGNVF